MSPKAGGENGLEDVKSRTESSLDILNPVSPLTPSEVDWDEVAELLDASYRLIATKRLLKLLDQDD